MGGKRRGSICPGAHVFPFKPYHTHFLSNTWMYVCTSALTQTHACPCTNRHTKGWKGNGAQSAVGVGREGRKGCCKGETLIQMLFQMLFSMWRLITYTHANKTHEERNMSQLHVQKRKQKGEKIDHCMVLLIEKCSWIFNSPCLETIPGHSHSPGSGRQRPEFAPVLR